MQLFVVKLKYIVTHCAKYFVIWVDSIALLYLFLHHFNFAAYLLGPKIDQWITISIPAFISMMEDSSNCSVTCKLGTPTKRSSSIILKHAKVYNTIIILCCAASSTYPSAVSWPLTVIFARIIWWVAWTICCAALPSLFCCCCCCCCCSWSTLRASLLFAVSICCHHVSFKIRFVISFVCILRWFWIVLTVAAHLCFHISFHHVIGFFNAL